ncbi:MAG: 50S ribosome-binding GTPase [Candidatus Heimdallarchaeota archaeon]|nr:MAG: 50S ribosome-binding GTPase [Candidatus Heimdallarchaeota archaeon]
MSFQYQNPSKKIVFLGLAESGKSTIINSVIEGTIPQLGEKYDATINYQRKKKTLCGTELNIFDLGGQTRFLDRFTGDLSEFVFSDVDIFIYTLDPLQAIDLSRAKYYLELSLERLDQFSPKANIHVLLHKMDLLPKRLINNVSGYITSYLKTEISKNLQFHKTSVFSESIYMVAGEILAQVLDFETDFHLISEELIHSLPNIVSKVQIMTQEGILLHSNENKDNPSNLSAIQIRKLYESSVQHLVSNGGNEKRFFSIEVIDQICFLDFLDNGLALLILISNETEKVLKEETTSIYDQIISISNQISLF